MSAVYLFVVSFFFLCGVLDDFCPLFTTAIPKWISVLFTEFPIVCAHQFSLVHKWQVYLLLHIFCCCCFALRFGVCFFFLLFFLSSMPWLISFNTIEMHVRLFHLKSWHFSNFQQLSDSTIHKFSPKTYRDKAQHRLPRYTL